MKRVDKRFPARNGSIASLGSAETLGAQALDFLAADLERLGGFLAATGIAPTSVRTAAREPGFLRGVLGYVMADESLLIALASRLEVGPDRLGRAIAEIVGSDRADP